MNQLTLFPQPTSGEIYWNAAETSGSALRQFYSSAGEQRMSAYSQFAKSCEVFAQENGISFLEASQKIHNMFNINTGNR